MIKALNTSATGMQSQEANVNVISNNIANVNTTGFKKGRAEFEDLLYETRVEAGARSSAETEFNVGTQIGSGSKISAVRKDMGQGNPQVTNNVFDLLIRGEGMFGVMMPDGQVHYTRDGAFNVDAQGQLVTKKGHKVFPGITMPQGTTGVNIAADGKAQAYVNGSLNPTDVGQISVFTFTNPVGLKALGGNLFGAGPASGAPIQNIAGQNGSGQVVQGSIESSNVSIMNEMTGLIKAQRAYEMNAKVMSMADQMLQTVNNIR